MSLPFNTYFNDLSLSIQRLTYLTMLTINIYAYDTNLGSVTYRLETDTQIVIEWYPDDSLQLNAKQCHFLVLLPHANSPATI